MQSKVSIVVPVYNKEAYLADCLESLRVQTEAAIEVVLVDDGSTDGSAAVCRAFCARDARFRYVYQENQGQNAARLAGVRRATADFVIFVDADDFVTPDMCEVLLAKQKETGADIVSAAYQIYRDGAFGVIRKRYSGVFRGREAVLRLWPQRLSILEHENDMPFSLCHKVIRTSLALDALVHMDLRIRYAEDAGAFLTAMFLAEKVVFLPDVIYFYREVETSCRHSHDGSKLLEAKWLQHFLYGVFAEHHAEDHRAVVDRIVYNILNEGGLEYFNDYPGLYPFFEGDRQGRVAVYGAGILGQELVSKLRDFEITQWYDRDYEFFRRRGLDVRSPQEIDPSRFDVLVIAIRDEHVGQAVCRELTERLPAGTRIYPVAREIVESAYTYRKLEELKDVDEDYRFEARALIAKGR